MLQSSQIADVTVLQPKVDYDDYLIVSETQDDRLTVWLPKQTMFTTEKQKCSVKLCTDRYDGTKNNALSLTM